MKFARYTFFVASIYGLLVLVPQYFLEDSISAARPPAITHPEFFYGFIGLAAVFQIVFLIIGMDPVKYRLMIIPSILEKLSFGLAALCLYLKGRLEADFFYGGMVDLVLAAFFVVSWFKVPKS